jgi:hypothetical protein
VTKPYAGMEEQLKEQLRVGVSPFVGKLFRTGRGEYWLLMKVELNLKYSLDNFTNPRFNFTHLDQNGNVKNVFAIDFESVDAVIRDISAANRVVEVELSEQP